MAILLGAGWYSRDAFVVAVWGVLGYAVAIRVYRFVSRKSPLPNP